MQQFWQMLRHAESENGSHLQTARRSGWGCRQLPCPCIERPQGGPPAECRESPPKGLEGRPPDMIQHRMNALCKSYLMLTDLRNRWKLQSGRKAFADIAFEVRSIIA